MPLSDKNIDILGPKNKVDSFLGSIQERAEYAHTEDARLFLGAADKAHVELSELTLEELRTENDRRYGDAYAWMTRATAAWISKDTYGPGVSLLKREEPKWSDELDEYEAPSYPNVANLSETGSPGADLLIDLIKQTAASKEAGIKTSDIPVTSYTRSFRQESCKDVEVYFLQALSGFSGPNKLMTVNIGQKQFWHKTHGAPTYINLEEVAYNGVALPPGCVFRKEDDGGYLFTRVTGLAFEQQAAEEIFGSAISSWKDMYGGEQELHNLFDEFQQAKELARQK